MENGLKVQSGERIGKSVVFAYNHRHAELIVRRFNILYPEYGPDFCALIDNYVTYSQDLFKIVKSRIKFMQMIGRGTRLSENIFGPSQDKECFYIFDWCRNFEYFEKNPNGQETKSIQSLTERLFSLRTDMSCC